MWGNPCVKSDYPKTEGKSEAVGEIDPNMKNTEEGYLGSALVGWGIRLSA
jgi:hypothetical protein